MILPQLTYCLISWAQACCTTLKPIQSVYKQALKVIDRKPNSHCYILRKHEFLSWENLMQYIDACLVFKILNGLAPPPLSIFDKQKTQTYGSRSTRSAIIESVVTFFLKKAFITAKTKTRLKPLVNAIVDMERFINCLH